MELFYKSEAEAETAALNGLLAGWLFHANLMDFLH